MGGIVVCRKNKNEGASRIPNVIYLICTIIQGAAYTGFLIVCDELDNEYNYADTLKWNTIYTFFYFLVTFAFEIWFTIILMTWFTAKFFKRD